MPTLANRYDLAELVYSDEDVAAYHAHDRLLNRAVTVELLHAQHAAQPAFAQRLINKARTAALANLPLVAALYDQHVADGRPFLVLEEIAGPALAVAAPLHAEQAAAVIGSLAEVAQVALTQQLPLPIINEHTVRIGQEGRVQILDLGLSAPSDQAQLVAQLGRLLALALAGAADMPPQTALGRIAQHAMAGQIATSAELLAQLQAVEVRASEATTMIPRVPLTVPIESTSAFPARSTTSATPAPIKRSRLLLLIGGLLLVGLIGGAVLRNSQADSTAPLPSSAANTQPSPAAASSAAVPAGERYVVAARNSRTVRVRSGPGLASPQITSLENGTSVQVVSAPQPADGYNWVRIVADGVDGWCILEALRKE